MKVFSKTYWPWVVMLVGGGLLFLFFFQVLPYHLFHREQTQLFLFAVDSLAEYFRYPAALSRLSGDFLTQLFYYEGGGPLVLSVVLLGWGMVVFRLLRPYLGRWTWIPAVLAVLWEAGRQCGLDYPLSGTLSLIGLGLALLLCRNLLRRSLKVGIPLSVLVLAGGYYLFGCADGSSKWYGVPNLDREYKLAFDSEMYFGRTDRVRRLLAADDRKSSFATYYYNLLNLKQGRLPDGLMDYYQPAAYGLFLPVAPSSDYLSIYAANEVWFALGDMTMAEHAAILGMIFSPRCTGARAVKRLAEINLVNGDDAAAMKYLRLLQHTLCYRRWAEARMPGRQTEAVKQWLEEKRRLLPVADTLRAGMAVPFSLRHLIEACPDNSMAVHSLLCFDLLNKDIDAFITDYQRYGFALPQARLYSEAILIYLAGTQRLAEQADWKIPAQVLAEFKDYTRMYEANGGNGTALQARYRHTYWFYFHYATMKN